MEAKQDITRTAVQTEMQVTHSFAEQKLILLRIGQVPLATTGKWDVGVPSRADALPANHGGKGGCLCMHTSVIAAGKLTHLTHDTR